MRSSFKRPPCIGSEAGMRIVVDLNRCEAYAQCVFLAPDVFTLHGEEALLYEPRVADADVPDVLRAAAACPVQAILVDFADKPLIVVTAGRGTTLAAN